MMFPIITVQGLSIPRNTLPEEQVQVLIDRNLITIDNDSGYKVLFVGCIEVGKNIIISLPYGFSATQLPTRYGEFSNFKPFIIKLIKCIRIFQHHFSAHKEIVSSGKLGASFSLIEDFEENGFITKYIKSNTVNGCGSINWNKTIKSFQPFKVGDSWLYKDVVTRNNIHHDNHELILVHKWALTKAIEYSSLLTDSHESIEAEVECHLTEAEVTEIVTRIYPKSTKDRDIYVLDLVLQLLDEQKITEFSAIYTTSFHVIWEVALQAVLDHEPALKEKAPQVTWNDDDIINKRLGINNRIKGTTPEVDIIFENKNRLHILDAKYYDVINNNNRPGLTDLYKQFYYGQMFKNTLAMNELPQNGLVFPCYIPEEEEYLIKFSNIKYDVKLGGNLTKVTEIPAYVASIDQTIDAFITHRSLQESYLQGLSVASK